MVRPAEHLGIRPKVQTGEVEEGQEVTVADVEEEVVRALVVPILEDLGQRELQHLLVELHGPLDVRAQHGEVVQARAEDGGRSERR